LENPYPKFMCNLKQGLLYYQINKRILSDQIIKTIYYAHLQSHMQYGVNWGLDSDCIKIFRIQKKVIRLTTGNNKLESCKNSVTD
jgi:hypothetical protein